MTINLIFAIAWFLAGAFILTWEFLTGEPAFRQLRILDISWGWLAFPFCLYNLARWWNDRSLRRILRESRLEEERHFRETQRNPERGRDIDPNFDFTSNPAPPPKPNITDHPSSLI
jgi:hypothetical protein